MVRMTDINDLKYPIGRFRFQGSDKWVAQEEIKRIATLPENLRSEVQYLSDEQLDTCYRPGGWTLRQVIHHLPDSHMNAYIRFKLALTEENPIIKPYHEDRWAECKDAKSAPIIISLNLLESIHIRWVEFIRTLTVSEFDRTYHHPAADKDYTLKEVLSMYAWHGEHHLAHISQTKRIRKWQDPV
jgi:hypothetical protein